VTSDAETALLNIENAALRQSFLNAPKRTPRSPRYLPSPRPGFVGCKDELQQAMDTVCNERNG